jgi:hypothetical protein
MNALPQAIPPNPYTNLLNVYIQIASKMGFQQQQNGGHDEYSVASFFIEVSINYGDCKALGAGDNGDDDVTGDNTDLDIVSAKYRSLQVSWRSMDSLPTATVYQTL